MSSRAALPDAMTTIIVSPMARPNPSTVAAAIPGAAAGKTTRRTVCDGVDPIASAASRYERGTARSASSDTEKTIGTMANDKPKPATSALSRCSVPNTCWTHVASTMSAKKPTTTEGTPARSSMAGLTISRRRPFAYSDTKTAAATLMGPANTMATSVTFTEPTMSGITLYFGTSLTGCQTNAAAPCCWMGTSMLQGVTSRCTSTLVRSGMASLPTKTRMRRIAAIDPRATTVMASSMSLSRQLLPRRSDRFFSRARRSCAAIVVGLAMRSGLGERIVANDLDHLLSVGPLDPLDETLGETGRFARGVEVEKARDRVRAALRRLERRRDRFGRVVLFHLERADPFQIRDASVADPEDVALHGARHRRGPGQR